MSPAPSRYDSIRPMDETTDNRRLLVALTISLFLHALAALFFISLPSSAGARSFDAQSLNEPAESQKPLLPEEDIPLGLDEGSTTSITWIGFKEFQEQFANKSIVDQPELTNEPSPGPQIAQIPNPVEAATPVEPAPPAPAQPPQPDTEAPPAAVAESNPESPQVPEPPTPASALTALDTEPAAEEPSTKPPAILATPAEDVPPPPIPNEEPITEVFTIPEQSEPLPDDTTIVAPGEIKITDLIAPLPAPMEEPDEPSPPQAPLGPDAPAPENDPTKQTVQPESQPDSTQQPSKPSTPVQPTAPPTPSGADDAGIESDRESVAASINTAEWKKLGQPLTAKGLEIKTRRPRFTQYTRIMGAARDPVVKVHFRFDGRVEKVELVNSSGNPDVDRPVIDAVYQWRAVGKQLELLKPGPPPQTLPVEFRVLM